MTTNIGSIPVNEKVDATNYYLWSLKVQFLLNNGGMVEFLTGTMFAPAKRGEHGEDVTASEQYQEKLKEYETWFKRDHSTRYTLLSCMHNDPLGEFECCTTVKDMWDLLKIWFSQTFTTRLRNLCLKWMEFKLDVG